MSTEAISPLRQRMIEDMNSRKLGAHTQPTQLVEPKLEYHLATNAEAAHG